MDKIRARVFVSGRVQGVFFRAWTRERALEIGVSGSVRNLPDGRVEAVIEGARDAVEAMIEELRGGPPRARVDNLSFTEEASKGEFVGFTIRD